MIILLGSRSDPETQFLSSDVDEQLFTEDFMTTWTFEICQSQNVRAQVNLRKINSTWSHILTCEDTLIIRGSDSIKDPTCRSLFNTVRSLSSEWQTSPFETCAILEKISQLKEHSSTISVPLTIVTNQPTRLPTHQRRWASKGLGNIRTACAIIEPEIEPLCIPSLFQEVLTGPEFKSHIATDGKDFKINTYRILSRGADYRHDVEDFRVLEDAQIDTLALEVAHFVHQKSKSRYFDIDFKMTECGKIKFLEWNQSPAENFIRTKLMRPSTRYPVVQELFKRARVFFIGPRGDRQISALSPASEHTHETHLYLEDYGIAWHLCIQDGLPYISIGEAKYPCAGMYIRLADPELGSDHINVFFRSTDLINEFAPVIGSLKTQYCNHSKPLQLAMMALLPKSNIRVPKTHIVKGKPSDIAQFQNPKWIFKSISSERSIVCLGSDTLNWPSEGVSNTPVLVQECSTGMDVRVHALEEYKVMHKVPFKDDIDFRYSKTRVPFVETEMPEELHDFCSSYQKDVEQNPLMGFDFLKEDDGYVALEANPSPGWLWFYQNAEHTCPDLMANSIRRFVSPNLSEPTV